MKQATDELLIQAYELGLRLGLDQNFLGLLKEELTKRNLIDQIEANNSSGEGIVHK